MFFKIILFFTNSFLIVKVTTEQRGIIHNSIISSNF